MCELDYKATSDTDNNPEKHYIDEYGSECNIQIWWTEVENVARGRMLSYDKNLMT